MNNSELDALDAMLDDIDKPVETKTPQAQKETPPVEQPTEEPATATAPEATEEAQPETPAVAPEAKDDDSTPEEFFFDNRKQNQAFAAMRVENRQLSGVVDRLAKIMGISQGLTPSQKLEQINNQLIAVEAEANEVPQEYIQQAERLTETEAQLLRTHADLGFQKVKDTYNLSKKDLNQFAQDLAKQGKNPYQESFDLLQEYKLLNFDKLMKQAQDKGAEEERARVAKVAEHSTKPAEQVSAERDTSPKKIDTVAGLDQMLNQMPKK